MFPAPFLCYFVSEGHYFSGFLFCLNFSFVGVKSCTFYSNGFSFLHLEWTDSPSSGCTRGSCPSWWNPSEESCRNRPSNQGWNFHSSVFIIHHLPSCHIRIYILHASLYTIAYYIYIILASFVNNEFLLIERAFSSN